MQSWTVRTIDPYSLEETSEIILSKTLTLQMG